MDESQPTQRHASPYSTPSLDCVPVSLGPVLPDEFQDGISAGSLVQARRCWLDLLAARSLQDQQRFAFRFHCPTEGMAVGLLQCLRYADPGSYVRMPVANGGPAWQIVGTTNPSVWSLSALEHLFMRLRSAGRRYESTLDRVGLLSQGRVSQERAG